MRCMKLGQDRKYQMLLKECWGYRHGHETEGIAMLGLIFCSNESYYTNKFICSCSYQSLAIEKRTKKVSFFAEGHYCMM